MKKQLLILTVVACAQQGLGTGLAAPEAKPVRIGVYDSRVVAYAHFWSREARDMRDQEIKAAQAAKAAGETARFNELSKGLAESQRKSHGQVFSTAPASEALVALQPRLAAIQKEARVSVLVSKWDKENLKAYKGAEQVDVTDLLAREFKPGDKQLKVIEEIKKQQPVPLEQLKDND
jgi:hypothetical protein